MINIYLIIKEMENSKTDIKLEYKQSGLLDGSICKRLSQIATIAGTLATGYGTALSYISYKDSINNAEQLNKISNLAEETKVEVFNIAKNSNSSQQLKNMINDILLKINEVKQKHKIADENSTNVSELLERLNNLPKNSNEKIIVLNLLNSAQEKARYSFSEARISLDRLKNTSLDYNKDLDIDIKESFIGGDLFIWFENLDIISKFSVFLLLSCSGILSSITSIIYIIYGDYLMNKYQLNKKYPKLANIIQLRKNFQRYILIFNITIIIIISLTQLIFAIFVLTY